ncbi:MAG: Do family serine endopeptidase [Candidatus Binataceae bacterium]
MPAIFRSCFSVLCASLVLSIGIRASADEPLWTELPAELRSVRAQTQPDFADLAEKLSPAVVSISIESADTSPESSGEAGSAASPLEEFPRFGPGKSLGSGFVITRDGYILTNEHVVQNVGKIRILTQTGEQYVAKIVGRDSKSDVALLKIEAKRELPVAPLGNSDDLRVGQWVMAIGNPFGFSHSVTVGIVSAKGRFIPGNFDELIQTDASINQGNSGGPLIDARGQVVGINSAIFTRTGMNIGIGFAIPINLVKEELPQLRATGRVRRGWLGVYIQTVTPELADSMGLSQARGALIAEVLAKGPASVAGLKRGDVILAYDEKNIDDSRELPLLVGRSTIGHQARLKVVRDKAQRDVAITITESREEQLAAAESRRPALRGERAAYGLALRDLDAELARELGVDQSRGVVVAQVQPGSRADQAGLRARDVILEVNRTAIADVSSYNRALKDVDAQSSPLLLVRRGSSTIYVALKPES